MVEVNYLAVIVCAVVSMVIGSIWYGPLFGKTWSKLMKFSPEHMEQARRKSMGKLYAIAFLGSLVMAYVLAHSLIIASAYFNATGLSAGIMAGFWNWLGFVGPVTLGMVLWEGKPWKLWILLNSYQLVTLCVMGMILAVWR